MIDKLLILFLLSSLFSQGVEAHFSSPVVTRRSPASRPRLSVGEQVDALFAPWSKGDTPGAAVVIIQNGKIRFKKAYGLANLATSTPITPDTAFRLASVTKQFTAMTIMMLVERGKLKYDDRLSQFFPEFPANANEVTIRQLLNHSAGFTEYDELLVKTGRIDHDWPRSVATKPSSFEPTSQDVMELLKQQKELEFVPGEKWKYSNSGYVILAQIVEKVSGRSFGQFLQENIFRPLGMNRSVLIDVTRPTIEKVATSYTHEGGAYKEIDYAPSNSVYGEDNIYSTILDMYKWDQALYTEKLVSSATLKQAFTPGRLSNGEVIPYGFGWRIGKFLGLDRVMHSGSWLGFRTCILRFPSQRFTVVILANSAELNPNSLASKISKICLADKMTFPVAKQLDAHLLRDYVGTYEFAPDARAEVSLEKDGLWIKPPNQPRVKLLAESQDVFFVEGMEENSLVFKRDENRTVIGFAVRDGNSARKLP